MILLHALFILLYPLPLTLLYLVPASPHVFITLFITPSLYHSLFPPSLHVFIILCITYFSLPFSMSSSLPFPSLVPCLHHSRYHFLFPPSFHVFITLCLPNFLSSCLPPYYLLSPSTLFLYSHVSFQSLLLSVTITTSHN